MSVPSSMVASNPLELLRFKLIKMKVSVYLLSHTAHV